jgi:endonuclease/exonuclease/phosphatase (EEP) superfamily protein YafD
VTVPATESGDASPRPSIVGRVRATVIAIAVAALTIVAVVQWVLLVFRPEAGLAGVLQVLAPHLALVGLVLVPFGLLARRRVPVGVAALLVLAVVLRFGSDWVSLPRAAAVGDATHLAVISWNLEVASRPGADTAAMLRTQDADIVAVQELRPDAAAGIEADPNLVERYPYRVLVPRGDVGGMGILSRLPILTSSFRLDPIVMEATIQLGSGRRLAIVNAHPFHAEFDTIASTQVPIGIDPSRRNADLVAIRGRIDALIGAGIPVVMLGDLNTAASEPAFDRFVTGLRDVHRDVGFGPGWTWRPIRLEFLGFGLVRIDHAVVSPDITPETIDVRCPPIGDHCLVRASIAVPGAG